VITFALFFVALRGVPVRAKVSSLPLDSISRVCVNALSSLFITSVSTLYTIVDRRFASSLPTGSVAAISYGGAILGIMSAAVQTPLTFFLAKLSRLVTEDKKGAVSVVQQTLALVVAYLLPVSFFTAAAARPIISIVYGWGNFDARSIEMTSICLAGYNIGMVFGISSGILYRYAQALQRLARLTPILYLFVGLNAVLDWLLVGKFGLLGLAAATSLTQLASCVFNYKIMMDDSLWKFLVDSKFFQQLVIVLVGSAVVWFSGRFGTAAHLACLIAVTPVYFLLAERMGLMPCVPEHWRPRGLVSFLAAGADSFRKI
jgi:putative peptidoglycan lipid II flippase